MSTLRAPRERRGIILLSEYAAYFGGGQRSLHDLAVGLDVTRYRPVVVLPGPGTLAAALEEAGVEVRQIELPRVRGRASRRLLQTVWALATLARTRDACVLHSDSPRSALYAGLAARLSRRAHLWHVRASIASSAVSDRALLGVTDRAVAVSHAAADRSAALRAAAHVRVVPTGMRPPDFLDRDAARQVLGLPLDRFVAGVVGRVEPDKGGDDAVAALPLLRTVEPGALLAFLGAVDDRSPFVGKLRRLTQEAGLADAVRFLGEKPEAAPLLRAFDIILHPSRHEALPRVLIEAQFAGLPIVAASVGGVPEIVDHGRTGLLVPPRHPGALGEGAAAIARDPARGRDLGRAGALTAGQRFGLDTMIERISGIYDELRQAPDVGAGKGSMS